MNDEITEGRLLTPGEIAELVNAEEVVIQKRSQKHKKKPFFREITEVVVLAVIAAIFLKTFIIEMYWVPSESMVPTIVVKDRVVVTKFNYWFREPEHGEVVVFQSPTEENKNLIKRLIGVPGDTVEFKDNSLYINGEKVDEPYLSDEAFSVDYGPITLPEKMYFMCGDNRQHSLDSRSWGFVSEDLLIGKGVAVYWPVQHANWL